MQSDAGNAFHVDGPLHDLLQLADFHHGVFSVIITMIFIMVSSVL